MFGYAGENGTAIPLCLDCSVKYEALLERRMETVERQINFHTEQIERTVGLPGLGPRFPTRPPRAVLTGAVTLHNINISGGSVGVVNTGSIGRIDNAVGTIAKSGEPAAAAAMKEITEAVANSGEMTPENKKRVLDSLSLVAAEATAPRDQRRGAAMLR